MALRLKRTKGIGAVAANVNADGISTTKLPEASTADIPFEGKTIERGKMRLQFQKVPTGRMVWDGTVGARVPEYYSLKTWFSHHTEGLGPGPGWDRRYSLSSLTDEEMLKRYGHVFKHDEIFSPSGDYDWETGDTVGGMPTDIPYYDLAPVNMETESVQ